MSTRPDDAPPADVRGRLGWWFWGIVAAAAVPRLLTAGRYVTTDEFVWMNRTVRFSDALLDLDLSNASASVGEPATMPGSSTMWLGTVGRVLWKVASLIGLVDSNEFFGRDGLAVAQSTVAVATALLVGMLFLVVARWAGTVPAFVAAVVVATEPWIVAHGAVLHTDELTALFGTIGLVALAHAFGIPDPARRSLQPEWMAAFAGLMLMASALTKVIGVAYWTGAGVLAVWAFVRHRRSAEPTDSPIRPSLVAAGAGLLLVPLAWPALIVDPFFQFERLTAAAGLGSEDPVRPAGLAARQFFRGEPVDDPGWAYYAVALPLRMTPWFLLAALVGIPLAFWRTTTRWFAVALLPSVLVLAVLVSTTPKKFDRYGLVVLVPLAVLAGLGIATLVRQLRVEHRTIAGVASGALLLASAVFVAPYGLAYFNPALGGSDSGADTLLVGWGEGAELAAEQIEAIEDGDCAGVTVRGLDLQWVFGWRCAQPPPEGTTPDYVVLYVNRTQRSTDPRAEVEDRELVGTVEIRGIRYAEIWR